MIWTVTETLYIEVFEDICKKYNHYFSREYSIYHKDYPWLEDMLEIADDEFVSYYVKCAWVVFIVVLNLRFTMVVKKLKNMGSIRIRM